jgi:predicted transcriptional regulator
MDNNDERLYHQFLIRLDNELAEKLYNHASENDMKLSGVIRRSLRQYLQQEESRKIDSGKKQEHLK